MQAPICLLVTRPLGRRLVETYVLNRPLLEVLTISESSVLRFLEIGLGTFFDADGVVVCLLEPLLAVLDAELAGGIGHCDMVGDNL